MHLEIAQGTIVGRDHVSVGKVLVGKPNQDAACVQQNEHALVGVVCDGCGSCEHSEFGARFGATLTSAFALRILKENNYRIGTTLFKRLRADMLSTMHDLARKMGGSYSNAIIDHFLFTTIGVIVTAADTIIFSIGDGVVSSSLSGGLEQIGPFPNNEPPYLAYNLVDSSLDSKLLDYGFLLSAGPMALPILIGSDGVWDLHQAALKNMPGTIKPVGPVSQFWTDDTYFTNPIAVTKKLRKCNSEVVKLNKETHRLDKFSGLLPDDTTLIAIRYA